MLVKSKVKYIQTLGQKKFRESEGIFIAEGPKIVSELLTIPEASVHEVFALDEWIEENEQLLKDTKVTAITGIELEKISQLSTPNKVVALIKQFNRAPLTLEGKITLAIDDVQDPGNLGTIIRTADWFGIRQIICSLHCADIYNPKVVQATMGSIARVNVQYADLAEWLSKHKEVKIFSTGLKGKPVMEIGKLKEGIIIIGNESKGIHPAIMELADEEITIPRRGEAESLNAAIATAIILSHIYT